MRLLETQPNVDLLLSKQLSEVIMDVDTYVVVGGGGGVNGWGGVQEAFMEQAWK